MDLHQFRQSLQQQQPPHAVSVYLQALWYDAKGNWEKAHMLIQDGTDRDSSLLHAYLHRKEGDLWNADWWYRKAGSERPKLSLEAEWESLVKQFCNDAAGQ